MKYILCKDKFHENSRQIYKSVKKVQLSVISLRQEYAMQSIFAIEILFIDQNITTL